ncbi:MAG: glutamate synthase [Oscillospiraceae bacterium]|nr:glutamate synthase [Oscillospiraceae bacterium]
MNITAGSSYFKDLNDAVRTSPDHKVVIERCLGQRYIAAGLSDKEIEIHGVPGNALGAYLNGATVRVYGNAQDATGDTMNDGEIEIHGSAGDAAGYAMRGGKIFVEGNAGYRAGIHMKAYETKHPVLVIGGAAGSFLGEYQAGGTIIVLGRGCGGKPPVGYFCGTGMHGGKMLLRCSEPPYDLPRQVISKKAEAADLEEFLPYIEEYCQKFGADRDEILNADFYVLAPDTKNPYKQLYTHN